MYPFSKYLSHCPVDYRTISHLMCWLAMLGYFKIAPPSANSVCVFLNCLCTVQEKALKYHTVDLFKSGRMEDPVLVFVHTSPFRNLVRTFLSTHYWEHQNHTDHWSKILRMRSVIILLEFVKDNGFESLGNHSSFVPPWVYKRNRLCGLNHQQPFDCVLCIAVNLWICFIQMSRVVNPLGGIPTKVIVLPKIYGPQAGEICTQYCPL